MLPQLNLLKIIKEGTKAVPATKYALGIAGLIAVVALVVTSLKIDFKTAFWGALLMFFLMTLLVVFAKLTKAGPALFIFPIKVLMWTTIVLFVTVSFFLMTSVFFKWPVDAQYFLAEKNKTYLIGKTSITILVRGKKGRSDIPLRSNGAVIIDNIGKEEKKEFIDINGNAHSDNLHIGDSLHLDIDFSEPYKSLHPDSIYVVGEKNLIYLEVFLRGINQVRGFVKYGETLLPDVKVMIDSLLATTDSRGYFSINIPENLQKKTYNVIFIKKGFRLKNEIATPETDAAMQVTMEK